MTDTNTSERGIAQMLMKIAAAESPEIDLVMKAFGGTWATTDHGAWREYRLSHGSELRGARSVSFAEYPLSKRYVARLAIELPHDVPTGRDVARDVRGAFGPWTPDHEPLPIASDGMRTSPSELPLHNEVCRLGPRTVLAINSYDDGRPDGIYIRWMR